MLFVSPFEKSRNTSPDPKPRFDERANGYARGEGICVMALKPLEDALRDGDTVRAVIRGSAINQDGNNTFLG